MTKSGAARLQRNRVGRNHQARKWSTHNGKETIKPPTKRELTDASKELRKGHPSGGRTLADKSVAVRQGVAKTSKRK
jgi:hypothetical protein